MEIRPATRADAEGIKNVHLQAFDQSEAELVAKLAVNLLRDKSTPEVISLVAIKNGEIVGHIAFSPVYLESSIAPFAMILAPLAVLPDYQKNKVGSSLVKQGLEFIANKGSGLVFVYGDPHYYAKFGFNFELAKAFLAPYILQYPEGWLALTLNENDLPEGGKVFCLEAFNDPNLW